jgi:hypothetical protein
MNQRNFASLATHFSKTYSYFMKLGEKKLYTKIIDLDEIYNFVVHIFFLFKIISMLK